MTLAALRKPASAKPAPSPQPNARAAPMRKARAPFGGALQAKLALSPVNDLFEREADVAAAHVVGNRPGMPRLSALPAMMGTSFAQRACAACGKRDEELSRKIQRKCACGSAPGEPCSCHDHHEEREKEEEHPELRIDRLAKQGGGGGYASAIDAVGRTVRAPGRPLPDPVRGDMETGFGRSFGHVRIHDNPSAAASAEAIRAHAYTVGNHIAFNRGKFQPDTSSGRLLIAHELAHTVQQSGASQPRAARVSQPGDTHERQAHQAASAAVAGAPMPALSPGPGQISRYSFGEFLDDASGVGLALLSPAAALVANADDIAAVLGDVWDTAVAIAEAVGGAVSFDGTTLVIDVPSFDPCPAIGFTLSLSDLGLDPHLYFPIAAGAFSVGGILTVFGALGVEANIDPGIGFKLQSCSFGPGQIRISPLSMRTTVSGMLSVTTSAMLRVGADLGLRTNLTGLITVPFVPPIVLVVPDVGISLGGAMEFMLQNQTELSNIFTASAGLGGVSASSYLNADVAFGLDLGYGLYGALSILGIDLCRVGWPLDRIHREVAANIRLGTSFSVGTSGLSFSFLASVRPLAANPLADLSFAFDDSRLQDDCWLCDFMTSNGLMPGQNGYNWAGILPSLPTLGGPRSGIYARNPGLASGALCRGTCGVDCPEDNCTKPYDLIICENVGDRHRWHIYENYATCGSHQGCRDHDACYDFAAMMPIWGFGGFMIGPMYRACDLEALCGYSFKQAVGWAMGGPPYDSRLRYADRRRVEPGCLGPCPQNIAKEGEPEVQQTCLEDRELWEGLQVGDQWGKEFFNQRLFQGFVEVPYIVGVHYGVDAAARADADASADLGPINLENACLIYDPATMTYTGTADMTVFLNGRASASITGTLEGFLSDFLCLLNWVTLRGSLTAGVTVQLPTSLTAGVDLYCAKGDLEVQPRLSLTTCLDIFGEISASLDVFLLSFNVWSQEWPLLQKGIQKCWNIDLTFQPFKVGTMPTFDLETAALQLDTLLGELFEPARVREIDRKPARSPLPSPPGLLFPCLDGDDDDDEDDKPDANCPTKATGDDGDRLFTQAERTPVWGSTRSISIPGGSSAAVASSMEVKFLTRSLGGGSDNTGPAQTGIYKHVGLPTAGCFTAKKKDSQHFIKGHLLNADVGGPAEDRNLFPITALANGQHKNTVERNGQNVVGKVKSNELIYYKVTVQNPSAPREIMNSAGAGTGFFEISATFLCEVADYQLCDNDTVKRNTIQHVPINSQFVFHPSDGRPFDQITDATKCKR